ncbi:hypothetical protein [Mycolicibacterium celeriflavum]|uniref:hypothetical protein n=1 Tax=Mycolicibacterium celeriflavum TaxID=1249101 RepID=UPI003CE8C48A
MAILDGLPGHGIRFASDDYSLHLRHADGWWVIDTVDDRGQPRSDVAKFSTYDLVEKYLIWEWSSLPRDALRQDLYALGPSSGVEFRVISEGIFGLQTSEGRAVMMGPAATIFSHLMSRSLEDIVKLVGVDI